MMNQNPNLIPLSIVTVVAMLLLVAAVTRVLAARQRATRLATEQPASQHTWQDVREMEATTRWSTIDLDALHEINRDEVKRLLARVEAAGVEALRPLERSFLDNLAGT
jgi:hypothetical protein